ncbi:MAG: hypothetical protein U0T81_03835 [Saprospiraceae bacterium]
MRKWVFYLAAPGLAAFEFFNVYFIMPMPGSQEINSIDVAYFLFTRRWLFRFLFSVGMLYGLAGFLKWVAIGWHGACSFFLQERFITSAKYVC